MKKSFQSSFSQFFRGFISLRHISGLDYSCQESKLLDFDEFLYRTGRKDLVSFDDVQYFLEIEHGEKSYSQKAHEYQIIRHFVDYLAAFNPKQQRLPINEYRRPKNRPLPRLFTEDELALLLKESKKISRHNEIRNKTLHAALAIAIACGLRRSEITNLRIMDVDLKEGRLFINETKFGKSRIIPIGEDLCKILSDYSSFRRQRYPHVTTEKFLITMHKTGMSSGWLYQSFRELLCNLGMASTKGRTTHLHDLRHTFAVRTISNWYRSGKDVQSLLPALATYMGHGHYSDTAYYFTMTAELLGIAVDNFDSVWKSGVLNEED